MKHVTDLHDFHRAHEAKLLNDYWNEVDAAMERFFGMDTGDVGITAFRVALAQVEGRSPEEFALLYGEERGLFVLPAP